MLGSSSGDGWLAIGLDVLTSVRRSARVCRVGVGDLATSGSLEVLSGPSVGQQGDACNAQMPATWRMPASSESVEDLDPHGCLRAFRRCLSTRQMYCLIVGLSPRPPRGGIVSVFQLLAQRKRSATGWHLCASFVGQWLGLRLGLEDWSWAVGASPVAGFAARPRTAPAPTLYRLFVLPFDGPRRLSCIGAI